MAIAVDPYANIWSQLDAIRAPTNIYTEPDHFSCKVCGGYDVVEDSREGDVICTSCGTILEQRIIDETAEWAFGPDDNGSKDPSRCGGPVNELLERSSMTTMMSKCNYQKHGNMQRLHQQSSMDYTERSRYHTFEEITKWAVDKGQLPASIVEHAKIHYKNLSEKRLSRGNVRKGLIACCIYFACKSHNVSRSTKEISDMCSITNTDLTRCIKIFKQHIDVSKCTSTDSSDLHSRVCTRLGLERRTLAQLLKKCTIVSDAVDKHCLLNGKTPTAVAVAVVYHCAVQMNLAITKKNITDVNNISMVTLNKLLAVLEANQDYWNGN